MNEGKRIETRKTVLKAGESVWAANKYFVLACSQHRYLEIRSYFRPDQRDLSAAYKLLRQTEADFQSVPSADLPELPNALYHVMGYFKKLLSYQEKQNLNVMIRGNSEEALDYLEQQTFLHRVDYLLSCRLWPSQREKPFNAVPRSLTEKEQTFGPDMFVWHHDYLVSS